MTRTTRRVLLRAGAAGLAFAPVLVGPDAFAAMTTRRGLYVRERFAALKHRTFTIEGPEGRWRVRLAKVGNLANGRAKDPHAFSLTFRTSRRGPAQGSYLVRRKGFRATTLFLVPSDERRRTYEAVVFRKP